MNTARQIQTGLIALVFLLGVGRVQAQTTALGETSFPNSGAEEAQEPFLRGLLMLHSFEYEDAREAFQEAQRLDPDFALAYWGEAMTHNHPVWFRQDAEAARAALRRLAPTPEGRLAKAPTEREKDYLRVLDVLYGPGDKQARDLAYAGAMRRLHDMYPDDLEAAAFYALSLLGTSHGGRDFSIYMRAGAVAEEVFSKNPNHPGAAHYLIHSYDDPIHAPLGLRAARAYSEIAPAASHALHMPSHIFVALGLWDDVVALNEASWAASESRKERKNLSIEQRGYHALWWQTYGYLQQGRYQEVADLVALMQKDAAASGSERTRFHLTMMRAAYVVDTEQWNSDAAHFEVNTEGLGLETMATDLFVQGLRAVRTGDIPAAEQALAALKARLDAASNPEAEKAPQVMALELQALLRLASGGAEEAVALMEEAAALEDDMAFDFGPPVPVKPAHELFGEILLELDRPAEAQQQFTLALSRAPKRMRSLLGLARAATEAGDETTARDASDTLRAIWHRADDDLSIY